jgi:hypothetical protein
LRAATMGAELSRIASLLEGLPALLGCRLKRTDSIVRKLVRERSMDLVRMDDLIGFRILVADPAAQRTVIERVTGALPVTKRRDYLDRPTASGYRGVHLIVRQYLTFPESVTEATFSYEVQIRTVWQHLWATTSESFGEQVKEGGGTDAQRAYLSALSTRIETEENANDALRQDPDLHTSAGVHFVVLDFDKAEGVLIGIENFAQDIETGIKYYVYLENRHRSDLGFETVLLGVPAAHDARKTHLRYFSPHGIPAIPDRLSPDLPRPD